ncbi:hypothetical protein [Chromobacterium violaceum]|uniref:hypothetical protein n=1 Tax=Chromobacterium violaceum TaxID=536 RepID=UPI001CE19221|nr:hypothetical protein [Chromobacterium violaceum]
MEMYAHVSGSKKSLDTDSWHELAKIKEILEYAILSRHDGKKLRLAVEEILKIKKEIMKVGNEEGFAHRSKDVADFIIHYIQVKRKLKTVLEGFGFDVQGPSSDKDIHAFTRRMLRKHHLNIKKHIKTSKVVERYLFEDLVWYDTVEELYPGANLIWPVDIEGIYRWWCEVKRVSRERGEEINPAVLVEIHYDESSRSFRNGSVPGGAPRLCSDWFLELYYLDPIKRLIKIESLIEENFLTHSRAIGVKKLLKQMDNSFLYKKMLYGTAERDEVFIWEMEKLFKSPKSRAFDIARGGLPLKSNQVEPALIGLMCWDARKEGRTIGHAVEMIMTRVSAEWACDNDAHGKFKRWQGWMNKKIRAGKF